MPTIVEAVVVDQALTMLPQYLGDVIPGMSLGYVPKIRYFKIGEVRWIDPGTGIYTRKTPDPTLVDLDCIENSASYTMPTSPITTLYSQLFTLGLGDLTFESPGTLKVRCFLDFGDANGGGPNGFWEIGVYADDPTSPGTPFLIGYGTIQKQIKTVAAQMTNVVRLTFSR
jgi:hypothetical protein